MKKQMVRIGEGIERNAWISKSGKYRVLDSRFLGYWSVNRYVVQYQWFDEDGNEHWQCVWYCGAILGAKTIRRAQELAFSAESEGLTL